MGLTNSGVLLPVIQCLDCDLTVLEELTSNAKQIQDDVLTKILKANANTEYLQRFLQGSADKELFKKNVPVVSYEDVKPYIDRVANGEPSDVISGEPITAFLFESIYKKKLLWKLLYEMINQHMYTTIHDQNFNKIINDTSYVTSDGFFSSRSSS
ncbi:hypothetical protein YC2023_069753 [Brassica napus]